MGIIPIPLNGTETVPALDAGEPQAFFTPAAVGAGAAPDLTHAKPPKSHDTLY